MLHTHPGSRLSLGATFLTLVLTASTQAGDFAGLDNSTLYDIDSVSGVATNLGIITGGPMFGFRNIDRAPDGTLYGLAPGPVNGYSVYSIDETTLTATLVQTGVSTSSGNVGFAVDPSGTSVWVTGFVQLSLIVKLDQLDLVTGVVTARGQAGGNMWGLGFDAAGDLFTTLQIGPNPNLLKVDQTDLGNSTVVGALTGVDSSAGLDLASDVISGALTVFSRNADTLHSVDTTTATATLIGTLTGASAVFSIADKTPPNLLDLCNGDGGDQMGCTDCPCANNSAPGTIGGCINSGGGSSRLGASGDPSVSLPAGITTDLRFGVSGAPAGAFCILNSGDAVAPQGMANPCFGLNSGAQSVTFDGLRCAVMNTRRHGGRSADGNGDVGVTNNPWGGEGAPSAGLAVAGGGFSSGQTRYFQVIHRDDPLAVCTRGLNTTQAIEVTFTP